MKPTVLIIDANKELRELLSSLLSRNSYRVESLGDTRDVLDFLAEKPVDLIVSDVNFPHVDGFELGRRIRSDPAIADIPLIYLTARAALEDEFEGYLAGCDAYLTKPFRARELLGAIDQVLQRRDVKSSGRLAATQEVGRVLAVIPQSREQLVNAAARQAGYELQLERELDKALSRLDRERFHLLVCEIDGTSRIPVLVREFMAHFGLAMPVVFLHRGEEPPSAQKFTRRIPVRVPTTPAQLAEIMKKAVADFSDRP